MKNDTDFPKEIFVRIDTTDEPYLIADEGMPTDEGPVARYRLIEQGEVIVTREFQPGTAIVGGGRDPK